MIEPVANYVKEKQDRQEQQEDAKIVFRVYLIHKHYLTCHDNRGWVTVVNDENAAIEDFIHHNGFDPREAYYIIAEKLATIKELKEQQNGFRRTTTKPGIECRQAV